MFEYQEPEASDNPEANQGTGSLPLPPSGATGKGTRSLNPEKVRHMLFGSLAGIDRTIKILHSLGYADPNDWSDPIPAPPSGIEPGHSGEPQTWMAILTKTVLIE
ncbi:hypothetical protein C8255_07365 [filamentous cyanobacterium CCP3]|nr:hypothetical protein C8255_07365 [filamentous cyanobacterium CCP3]